MVVAVLALVSVSPRAEDLMKLSLDDLSFANPKIEAYAKVKTELEGRGTAFLEMWAHVGGGQFFSKGINDVVSQRTD